MRAAQTQTCNNYFVLSVNYHIFEGIEFNLRVVHVSDKYNYCMCLQMHKFVCQNLLCYQNGNLGKIPTYEYSVVPHTALIQPQQHIHPQEQKFISYLRLPLLWCKLSQILQPHSVFFLSQANEIRGYLAKFRMSSVVAHFACVPSPQLALDPPLRHQP